MSNFYKQCTMTKGETSQVAWIPEEVAKVGKFVRIGDDNGWEVKTAGERKDGAYILKHERDFMTQRRASDI